ncbi:hypothetical protein [Cryobacterium sp. PH29-G1]|uniref:hypothetical protein n=1 Tax=Cryobacterium sp. PH29-G1 TaxID=3046211 RepID=UPI0024BB1543|nr:hypothetical protein [Cryobacterium sp. PH29-G1]MDJ0350086.1 hypothetical protein [Cryobacterium sp. PH29-G1]
MVHEGTEPGELPVLRTRRQLVARSVVATLSLTVPVLIVLYWLAIPRGTWPYVAAVQLGLTILAVVGILGAKRMRVTVTPHGLECRKLLGRVLRISAADINSVVLVELYQSGTVETLPHLYLLDSAGGVLLRLRGQIWPRSGLENLIDSLDVSVVRPLDPLTMGELARLRPLLVPRCARRVARLGI